MRRPRDKMADDDSCAERSAEGDAQRAGTTEARLGPARQKLVIGSCGGLEHALNRQGVLPWNRRHGLAHGQVPCTSMQAIASKPEHQGLNARYGLEDQITMYEPLFLAAAASLFHKGCRSPRVRPQLPWRVGPTTPYTHGRRTKHVT